MLLDNYFNKGNVFAIVGVSSNEKKFGFKIFKALVDKDFKVYAINPKEKEIYGRKVYSGLEELKKEGIEVDVIDFVVPANVTLEILETLDANSKVWFQPRTFDERCLKVCKKNKIRYVKDFCLLKETLEY